MNRSLFVVVACAAFWVTACADVAWETAAIQSRIDAASAAGGGRVVVTRGVHPCGTLHLKSGVELHLEEGAVLQGGDKSADYEDVEVEDGIYPEKSKKVFISAEDAHDIAITGKGVIDGQGPKFFDQNTVLWEHWWEKPKWPRPRMVQFMRCKNVRLEGVTFKDSPNWTMWLRFCENITVKGIRIDVEQKIINSDGIDFDACRHMRVSDSYFKTGDDCLILRAKRGNRTEPVVCEDAVFENCELHSTCQGVRIGCPSDDFIRDAVIRNMRFEGRNAVVSQQPYGYLTPGDRGYMKTANILFENWTCECVGHPVQIYVDGGIALRDFGHMTFRNFEVKAKLPFKIRGCAETVVRDIHFENIRGTIEAAEPFDVRAVEGLKIDRFEVTSGRGEATPFKGAKGSSWETVAPKKK